MRSGFGNKNKEASLEISRGMNTLCSVWALGLLLMSMHGLLSQLERKLKYNLSQILSS